MRLHLFSQFIFVCFLTNTAIAETCPERLWGQYDCLEKTTGEKLFLEITQKDKDVFDYAINGFFIKTIYADGIARRSDTNTHYNKSKSWCEADRLIDYFSNRKKYGTKLRKVYNTTFSHTLNGLDYSTRFEKRGALIKEEIWICQRTVWKNVN